MGGRIKPENWNEGLYRVQSHLGFVSLMHSIRAALPAITGFYKSRLLFWDFTIHYTHSVHACAQTHNAKDTKKHTSTMDFQ